MVCSSTAANSANVHRPAVAQAEHRPPRLRQHDEHDATPGHRHPVGMHARATQHQPSHAGQELRDGEAEDDGEED